MDRIMLNGWWKVCFETEEYSVQVPSVMEKYLPEKDLCTSFHYHKAFTMEIQQSCCYELHMEGISCAGSVFVNTVPVGEVEGIWTAHTVDITHALKNGDNHLEIIVEKPSFDQHHAYYFRSVLFGFIPDILFPFSGIYKDIYIEEKAAVHFEEPQVYFDYRQQELVVESKGECRDCYVQLELDEQEPVWQPYDNELRFHIKDIQTWSPQDPFRYRVRVSLWKEGSCCDSITRMLGYRTIQKKEDSLLLNECPIYFRGILHWGYYPQDYQITPDKEQARRELLALREQGFNAVKFCLFLPPQYYYDLCDELGILVWQEFPLWLPYDNGHLFHRIMRQYPEMMQTLRHHPSLFMISLGCELDSTISKETLDELYRQLDAYGTQAVICDNSGSAECYDGALHSKSDIYDYHFYGEIHNMQQLLHEFKHPSREQKPWFFGEFNDMDTFRNLRTVREGSSYPLYWADPAPSKNLLRHVHAGFASDMPVYRFEEIVQANDVEKDMQRICACALQKAYDVRKYNLETARRNNVNGYNITAIRDVPITSCGIFDDFNQKKWSDAAMQSVNGDMVLSMAAPLRRKWEHGADVYQILDEYNFYGGTRIMNRIFLSNHTDRHGECKVIITLEEEQLNFQSEAAIYVHAFQCSEIHQLDIVLPEVAETKRMCLRITLMIQGKQESMNSWDIWVYPKRKLQMQLFDPVNCLKGADEVMQVNRIHRLHEADKNQPLVTTVLTKEMLACLSEGCSIVYLQQAEGYFPVRHEPFWRECVHMIEPCRMLDHMAHKGYDSLQFLSLASNVSIAPSDIHKLTRHYERFISRIDNRRFHRSECMFRFKEGTHSIMVCTLNFHHSEGTQARSFAENIAAQNLLAAMIEEQESTLCN